VSGFFSVRCGQWEVTPSERRVRMSEAQAGARPSTAAYDPRFPYTNVTKMCWTNYVDFHRCARVKGSEDDAACAVFKKNFKAVCLESWVRVVAPSLASCFSLLFSSLFYVRLFAIFMKK
jgi:cytochrome c oxidase subunit 6b